MEILISLGVAVVWILCLVGFNVLCHWLMEKNPEFWGTVLIIFCILAATLVTYYTLFK